MTAIQNLTLNLIQKVIALTSTITLTKNAKFDWNESKFQKLKVCKDTVKSIIKTYGKASDAQISGDEMKRDPLGKDYGESVYLTFTKQYDGTFILSYASGRFSR